MTPNEVQTTPTQTTTTPVVEKKTGIGLKDILIPISIVIAGAFVGLGFAMSGGSGGANLVAQNQGAAQPSGGTQAADTTDQIDPITEEDWIKGNPDAPIKIVEFSDYDCPFCSRFHDTMNDIVENSDGQVAWIYRHFPLEQLHPQAPAVAVAAECVGAEAGNDGFWAFTDAYFAARGAGDNTVHAELVPQLALEAGATQAAFTSCFESGSYAEKVQAQLNNAVETGGRGTPWSILIGPDGETYPINGAQPAPAVQQLINLALQEAE